MDPHKLKINITSSLGVSLRDSVISATSENVSDINP